MSGPMIFALGAGLVALVALAAAVVLVVQVRRLRASVLTSQPVSPPMPPREPRREPRRQQKAQPPVIVERQPPTPALRRVEPEPPATRQFVLTRPQALTSTVAPGFVRAAALSYGVRRALRAENRDRVRALVRRDLRRRHRLRRQTAQRAARVVPLRAVAPRQERAS